MGTKESHLSHDDYEDAYLEALLCLQQTYRVGEPFVAGPAGRMCFVNGAPYTDRQILELWWGSAIAREILEANQPLEESLRPSSSKIPSRIA